jgi:hypothetical protein
MTGAYVLVVYLLLHPTGRVAEWARTREANLTTCTAHGLRWRRRDLGRGFVCVPQGTHFRMPR